MKRFASSVALVAQNLGIDGSPCRAAVRGAVRAYRERMAELGEMGPLDVWYERVDVNRILAIARERHAKDLKLALRVAKVRRRTNLSALPKLTEVVCGRRRIVDDPPLIVHEATNSDGKNMIAAYTESLPAGRRPLLDRYAVADTARKVVGIGSVGTRCYVMLLMDADARAPLFLQLKEAMAAVWVPYAGPSEYSNQGQRVVVWQRLMQAASDIFLGWTSYLGHGYYVRQFRDMKGSVDLDVMTPVGFASYAEVCGQTLARAHARSGDPAVIAGYLGSSGRFDEALAAFADSYAEQTKRDHAALAAAVESGRVTATAGG